ncbi:MAG: DNA recombination protein RmuC [Lachnospiraceae bacterium]|nr:DNA recombination protein RmuC [Lachnospiraceae bacterium]
MNSALLIVILALQLFIFVILVLILLRQAELSKRGSSKEMTEKMDRLSHEVHGDLTRLEGQIENGSKTSAEQISRLRSEVTDDLRAGMKAQSDTLTAGLKTQSDQLLHASRLQTESLGQMQDRMVRTLTDTTTSLVNSNEKKLDEIRGVVSDKLDKTLNERLDTNFRQIGDQLGRLYKSLGELQNLSEGVTDLNKTLTNVKTRGTWGEVQLGRILEQTLTKSQYEENVATKKNSSDRVEYAVRFPAPEGGNGFVYLPIDSKFPSDIYNHIVDASETGDPKALENAVNLLRNRILEEARTIRDKYIAPPHTTNYAIMFLPTEGLYAEVLRINGLTEQCQSMGILVAGPTTITAILNSLEAGFRNVALSKKSVEVMKLLEAVKAQFTKMDAEVEKTQKKLSEAMSSTDKLHSRTRLITRRMQKIGEMDIDEAESVIDLSSDPDQDLLPDESPDDK